MLKRIFLVGGSGAIGALALAVVQIRTGALFGAGPELDAFFVGAALPSVLLAISAGAISYVVVPRLPVDDPAAASAAAGRLAGGALLAGLILTAILLLAAPLVVDIVAPGLDSATTDRAALVLRIYSLSIAPTAAAYAISSLGHNLHRGYAAGLSTALYGFVWTALLFVPAFTGDPNDVALAGLIATSVQLVSAWALAAPRGLRPHLTLRGVTRPTRLAVGAAAVVLGATALGRLALLLDPLFGSLLDQGAVSQLTFATRILLLAVFAAGQGAAFSLMVVSRQEHERSGAEVRVGLIASAMLALAAASIFVVAGPALAELLLARGEFSSADASQVGGLLRIYGPAVVVMTLIWASEALLYASHRGRAVLRATAIGLAMNAGASALLVAAIGIDGRPLGVLVGYAAQLLVLSPLVLADPRTAGLRSHRTLLLLGQALAVQFVAAGLSFIVLDRLAGSDVAAVGALIVAGALTLPLLLGYERRALAATDAPALRARER